jgi:hypothetical protein
VIQPTYRFAKKSLKLSEIFLALSLILSQSSPVTRHDLQTSQKKAPASRGITLTYAAAQLGVTREHLSRVLNGHRQSRSLTRRFHALSAAAATLPTK